VVTLQFNYVRKIDGNDNYAINEALPFAAYTVVTNVRDVGPDNTTNTADDQILPLYSVPRTYPTFGQNIERRVQTTGNDSYHAFGVTLNKQYSNRYSFLVSLDTDYRDLADNAPRNPNEELYGTGTTTGNNYGITNFQRAASSWNYAFRVSGTYSLPWGLTYASSLNAQSGDYFVREIQVRDGNNANVVIRVNPQAGRYGWTKIWDNRVSKRIPTWGSQSLDLEFNVYNTLNINTITEQNNRMGATYLEPTEIVAPRVMRVGVKYRF
jgi:hypothetical protein